jgi:hypothetical protein
MPQGKWTILNAGILSVDQNNFDDRTALPGKRYTYTLECYDYYGGKSGMEPMVEVAVSLPEIHPPSGVHAYRMESGIEVGCDTPPEKLSPISIGRRKSSKKSPQFHPTNASTIPTNK